MPAFCDPWEFLAIFPCCFIFVARERSEILLEFNLAHCDILERSNSPVHTL